MVNTVPSPESNAGLYDKGRLFNADGIVKHLNEREEMNHPPERGSINMHRVAEALFIAFLTSVSVYVVSIAKLETKVDVIQRDITNVRTDIQDIRKDFYVPASRQYQYPQGAQVQPLPNEVTR